MQDRLNEYLTESCFRLSEDIIRCRTNAADKSHSYSYRLACDKSSANYETMIVRRAQLLISRLAHPEDNQYNIFLEA